MYDWWFLHYPGDFDLIIETNPQDAGSQVQWIRYQLQETTLFVAQLSSRLAMTRRRIRLLSLRLLSKMSQTTRHRRR